MGIRSLLAVLLLCLSTPLSAQIFEVTGKVQFVRSHNPDVYSTVEADWMALEGITSGATCGTSAGYLVIRIPVALERIFSLALTAQASGKQVRVSLDDGFKDVSGYCIVRWANIVN